MCQGRARRRCARRPSRVTLGRVESREHGRGAVDADGVRALALTGYRHFTTVRVEKGAVRGLTLHLDRLVRDCRTVFGVLLDSEFVRRELREALGGDRTPGGVVARITVFDPELGIGRPSAPAHPRFLVTTRPAPELPQSPLRVKPVTYLRQVAEVKHVGLFESLYLRRAAQLDGFDDALFLTPASEVSEGTTWNVGFYDGDRVVWPRADQLPGVTRTLLERVHGRCVTRPVTLDELPSMEVAFATNSAVGVRPISAVGPVRFPGEHPVLAELRAAYEGIAAEEL